MGELCNVVQMTKSECNVIYALNRDAAMSAECIYQLLRNRVKFLRHTSMSMNDPLPSFRFFGPHFVFINFFFKQQEI